MSAPIVERLRENAGWRDDRNRCVTDPTLLAEAADTITDLLAALEPFHREWLDMGATAHLADKSLMLDVDCGGEILTVGDWRKLMAAIAKAKGGAA